MPDEIQATETQTEQSAIQPRRDFRQEVTNQIIEMLENGTASWQKPWEPGPLQLPFNPTTEQAQRSATRSVLARETWHRRQRLSPLNLNGRTLYD